MPDYIERAAALNVNFKIPTRFSESKLTTARKAVQEYANEIAKIPAADLEPVVRCRDCIHLSGVTNGGTFFRCDRYDKWQDESQRVYMPLDGFCSYGQKGEKTNDS